MANSALPLSIHAILPKEAGMEYEGTAIFRCAMDEASRLDLKGLAGAGFGWICLRAFLCADDSGDPHAAMDYRRVDPRAGGEEAFADIRGRCLSAGLRLMVELALDRCSPRSAYAVEHPEWFVLEGEKPAIQRGELSLPSPGAKLSRRRPGPAPTVDFDFSSSPALWIELFSVLSFWRDKGAEGFLIDSASLVPLDFWRQARQRVGQMDPGSKRERHPLLWAASGTRPSELLSLRSGGIRVLSDPELHSVFDLTMDLDGAERLESRRAGTLDADLRRYLEYLYAQETLYPAGARKIRMAIAGGMEGISRRDREILALAACFSPGALMVDSGGEDAVLPLLKSCAQAKAEAPEFSWSGEAGDILRLERRHGGSLRYVAFLRGRAQTPPGWGILFRGADGGIPELAVIRG